MSTCQKALIGMVCWAMLGRGGSGADVGQRVPAPWTAVRLKSDAAGVEVGVWGRKCRFANAPLPARMSTVGEEILAAPIRLVGLVDGKPIQWQRSGVMVFSRGEAQVTLSGWQANDSLIVNTTVRVDFDGMMRLDLVVVPQRGASPRLEQLRLEVPLKQPRATLFHYWPERLDRAENSGAVADSGLAMPFKSLVWLGWEEGGLSWFAESDKGWQPEKPDRALEVVRQSEQTLLRVHLLDSPPLCLPLCFTFGLQATPVKPWPADFHEWRIWHAQQLGTTRDKSASVAFREWRTCHRAFPDGNPLPTLDRAAQLGVKTVVLHEDWAPIQNYPATTEEAELKRLVAACHQRGMKLLLYFGYELSSLAPEWAELSDEVLRKNAKGASGPGWHRLPEQREFGVCYRSRYQDLLVDGIARLMERTGFDGVYLDTTIEPRACCNERHGCGYRAADGSLRPTYPIFAVRRLMQRLDGLIHPRGGLINVHLCMCCMTPTLAFADSYWDGEQFAQGGPGTKGALGRLSLEAFRAEFMGRNLGVPCEFLAYERPPDWTFDHALAMSLLHDVRVRPHGMGGGRLEKMSAIWDVMTRFGASEAHWHPYWRNTQFLTAQPDAVKASLYLREAAATRPARALVVVSNLSAQATETAQVQLNCAGIGLGAGAVARDALGGQRLAIEHGRLAVPLPPVRMRLVWVE